MAQADGSSGGSPAVDTGFKAGCKLGFCHRRVKERDGSDHKKTAEISKIHTARIARDMGLLSNLTRAIPLSPLVTDK